MQESYLDYLANISEEEMGSSLKMLIKDYYDSFKPYLSELYHIEANSIYLNLVCNVSQEKIGSMLNISQYGVSKRVRGGLSKLSHLLKIPEKNRSIVRDDFDELLPEHSSEILLLYYFLRTFALTSRVTQLDSNVVNNLVIDAIASLGEYGECETVGEVMKVYLKTHKCNFNTMADLKIKYPSRYAFLLELREDEELHEMMILKSIRYKTYLETLIANSSYGDYTFKRWDTERALHAL